MTRFSALIFAFLGTLLFVSCEEKKAPIVKATPENIDSLLQVYPDSVELLVMRGNLAFKDYRFADALADGAKAFRLDSNNIDARMLYAQAQNNKIGRTLSDVALAQRHFHVVVSKQPKNTDALVALATTYGYQQDFEKAFKYVDNALRIDPKKRDAYVFKGSLFLIMGEIDLAKSSYETAVQQDPNFYEGYLRLGALYENEQDPICIEYYTTAYQLKPSDPETMYSLGYAYEAFGKIEEAKKYYRKMAQLEKDNYYISRGLFHLANLKQFQENDIDSAIYYYSSAIDTKFNYVEAFHNRAMCYESKGNKQAALYNYQKALEYDPNFVLSKEAIEKYR